MSQKRHPEISLIPPVSKTQKQGLTLLIVKVPPAISSMVSLLSRA